VRVASVQLRGGAANLNALVLLLRLWWLLNRHLEDAILVRGGDVFGLDAAWHAERATELAVARLDAMPLLVLVFVFLPFILLAANGQVIILEVQ